MDTLARAEDRPALPHVDKWHLLQELSVARAAYGLSDRELCVLEALLSFHPEQKLGGNADLIVFPSNRALSERCHGMAESTLRRHLGRLSDCGLILRHDSPNGKRYAARGADGEVLRAFGCDLRPLLVSAGDIAQAAQAAREAAARLKALRERISLQKRDAQKLAAYALEQGYSGTFETVLADLLEVTRLLRRRLSADALEDLAPRVAALRDQVLRDLAAAESANVSETENTSAKDVYSERQYQNSNTDSSDLEPCHEMAGGDPSELSETGSNTPGNAEGKRELNPPNAAQGLPLPLILKSLPEALLYHDGPIRSFDDLFRLATTLRGMIGISPSAWEDALRVMGPETAAVTVCCLVERVEEIKSPGGYLRHLTREAEGGTYSVARLVMAQLNRGGKS